MLEPELPALTARLPRSLFPRVQLDSVVDASHHTAAQLSQRIGTALSYSLAQELQPPIRHAQHQQPSGGRLGLVCVHHRRADHKSPHAARRVSDAKVAAEHRDRGLGRAQRVRVNHLERRVVDQAHVPHLATLLRSMRRRPAHAQLLLHSAHGEATARLVMGDAARVFVQVNRTHVKLLDVVHAANAESRLRSERQRVGERGRGEGRHVPCLAHVDVCVEQLVRRRRDHSGPVTCAEDVPLAVATEGCELHRLRTQRHTLALSQAGGGAGGLSVEKPREHVPVPQPAEQVAAAPQRGKQQRARHHLGAQRLGGDRGK
mmetsp:Transcript_29262/g.67150  ORF Transcript_29262/g.67150 Transcript_29262/m.67150 type:complete len:317 (+) Transcript_29262:784-1734(+)